MSAYAASKAAVVSLSQSMMAEWRKQNIRVITLTPSTIASDMSIREDLQTEILIKYSAGRFCRMGKRYSENEQKSFNC
jgi:NAD(P)-dependent dehydrogenase (short-subunit alcohol dehydrogenase family)